MAATAGTPRARALSAALREARKASGLGVRELARLLELSHTQISHWETGHRVPNVEAVAMILAALRISPNERERILELARNVGEPNWLAVGISGISQQLSGVVESERAASAIVHWNTMAIPGLLQTADYARAMMQSSDLQRDEIDLRVLVRMGRSEVLTRREPVRFDALLCETALHEPVGESAVMTEQLRHLNEMGKRSNVTVQIVPTGIGWHPGWAGPFVYFEFPDAPPMVHFEHYSSGAFVPTPHDVQVYEGAVARLRDVALSPAESAELIAKTANNLEITR